MAPPVTDQAHVRAMMQALDCFTWVTDNHLQLGADYWQLVDHEYQVDWLQCDAPRQAFIKGAQIGATECLVLKTLHGMIHEQYPQGALYLFPTRDDVGDFSQTRFDPLILRNDFIGRHVKGTDRKNVKAIGRGHLYLRGARSTKNIGGKRSSSQLKSIPVDRVVYDEMDEISPDMVILANERTSHSRIKDAFGKGEHMYLGTPTIPDHGIDAMYKKSDQRVWEIRCDHCGTYTCLDEEFPNCILPNKDGVYYRACKKCEREIYPRNGHWVARYPDRSKELVGWWISQLSCASWNPGIILRMYEDPPNGDLSEVMNSKLGRAYIPAENRLSPGEVYSCCGEDSMLMRSDGPCCMGVDVGRVLHVVIAQRKTERSLKIVKVCRVEEFSDLHDLAARFNVESAVIDLRPEIRKVREFQRVEPYLVFGCEYVEQKAGVTHWDEKQGVIKCNRTEILDATHELVVDLGRLELPRKNEELAVFVKECCNMAKTLEENPQTGVQQFRYRKLEGDDHYRHALGYCLLASDRCGIISDRNIIARFFGRRRRGNWMTA